MTETALRMIVYQNFLKAVVHVIITDQYNQSVCLYKIQVMAIYCRVILVTVMSECCVKRFICKTWIGTLANSTDLDQRPRNMAPDQGLHCLLTESYG